MRAPRNYQARNAAQRARTAAYGPRRTMCQFCGSEIVTLKRRGRPRNRCDQHRTLRPRVRPAERSCPCGVVFTPAYGRGSGSTKYHADECRRAAKPFGNAEKLREALRRQPELPLPRMKERACPSSATSRQS